MPTPTEADAAVAAALEPLAEEELPLAVGRARRESREQDVDVSMPLAAALAAGYRIIDIREPEECQEQPLPLAGQQSLPLGRLLEGNTDLQPVGRYLLVCAHGVRSHAAAEILRARGFGNVWSLYGGLAAQHG